MDYQDLVKRLRSHPVTNCDDDAADAIETLIAQRAVLVREVEALRNTRPLPSWQTCVCGTCASYRPIRAATDAAFKGGLPK